MPSKEEIQLAEERAIALLDAWMVAWNALNLNAWKATMQYPHYRLAGGVMRKWENAEMDKAYMERTKKKLSESDWHHSEWTRREIIHCTDEKIHVDTQFTRYRGDGSVIGAYDSLYILTWEGNRWGVKMRSSYQAN